MIWGKALEYERGTHVVSSGALAALSGIENTSDGGLAALKGDLLDASW